MATSFQTDGVGLWAEQDFGSQLDYTLDWTAGLDIGDVIADSQWTAEAGLIVSNKTFGDVQTTAWLSGGIAGRSYSVSNTVTTSTGRRDVRTFRLFVRDTAALGASQWSVFPSIPEAIIGMRRDRLLGPSQAWMAGIELSDEYLLEKLLSAQSAVERALRVFLTPVEVLPSGATDAERQALTDAGTRWIEEPGYDHEGSSMWGANWGLIELRQRPIIQIHEVRFAYPSPNSTLFVVPSEWLRLDKKYGKLQMVPVQSAGAFTMSSLVLSSLNAGLTIPLAIQIRYKAGLQNVARDYPDILNIIKRFAVLDVLDDQFISGSGSTSVDGLSQSADFDPRPHRQALTDRIESVRSSLTGIRATVL